MEFVLKMDMVIDGKVLGRMEKTFTETTGQEAIKHMLRIVREHQDKNQGVANLKIKTELTEKLTGKLVSIFADD